MGIEPLVQSFHRDFLVESNWVYLPSVLAMGQFRFDFC